MSETEQKQQQFMELFRPVQGRLSRYVRTMTNDNDEAKDIISETVLIAYEQFEKIREKDSFIFYLCKIARRFFKRSMWRKRLFTRIDVMTENIQDDKILSSESAVDIRILYDAFKKLSFKQREALTLFEIAGFSLTEICQIQHSKLSAVKARVRRGRQLLSKILGVVAIQNTEEESESIQLSDLEVDVNSMNERIT